MAAARKPLFLLLLLGFGVAALLHWTRGSYDIRASDNVSPASQKLQLDILAQVGPWPVASRLIGYRGKLWFANSVKGRNHNSADIWSYNPDNGQTVLERNLFSQDAGVPAVYKGLLYWPFEDALQSVGEGVVEVTDGERWQPLFIPNKPIYHTSEILEWKGGLLAITGSRNAGMQWSDDDGKSWNELYVHPTPPTHISRINEMTVFGGEAYASLRDAKVKRLVKWRGSGFQTLDSWPPNRYFNGLNVHRGGLFGIVGRGKKREIWRFDGKDAVQMDFTGPFVDMTSDGTRLWLVSAGGHLWSSEHGRIWERHGDLQKGRPFLIQAIAQGIYVAGAGDDGRGIVWGPKNHAIPKGEKPPALVSRSDNKQAAMDWEAAGQKIDDMLADPEAYQEGRARALRDLAFRASSNGAPSGFFAERLKVKIPDITVQAFGGNITLKAKDLAHSILLSAMMRAGHRDVPAVYITDRWTSRPNSFEKYFEIELGALRAVAVSGQNDPATIKALIARLDYADEPPWLRSQVIGVLTAVSGKHFGYDTAAWKQWGKSQF